MSTLVNAFARSMAFAVAVIAWYAVEATAQIAPPNDLPDRGVLRLQLGESITEGGLHAPRRFVHEVYGYQIISARSKCLMDPVSGPLAVLTAAGGRGAVGVGPDSIGVFDGPKGVACYRISADEGESIQFVLGEDISTADFKANAFYSLNLDVEVKSNAEILLEVLIGNTVAAKYYLRSGGSIVDPIVDGEGSTEPGAPFFECGAASDSGPDAGKFDNCRWIINELGNGFRIKTLAGEASWEGGGDWGSDAYANNSLIYLTDAAIGALGCENNPSPESTTTTTIGDGINDAQCTVTRLDPSTTSNATCDTTVGYLFRNIGAGLEGCELVKTPGEQLAASIDICFPPEEATELGDEQLTEIEFTNTADPENPVLYTAARCPGSVALDPNGNRIIPEVLQNPGTYDLIPGGAVEFACILDNGQEYLGTPTVSTEREMQVCQTILFWGDIRFSRR
jgi:hypothetical protein